MPLSVLCKSYKYRLCNNIHLNKQFDYYVISKLLPILIVYNKSYILETDLLSHLCFEEFFQSDKFILLIIDWSSIPKILSKWEKVLKVNFDII